MLSRIEPEKGQELLIDVELPNDIKNLTILRLFEKRIEKLKFRQSFYLYWIYSC